MNSKQMFMCLIVTLLAIGHSGRQTQASIEAMLTCRTVGKNQPIACANCCNQNGYHSWTQMYGRCVCQSRRKSRGPASDKTRTCGMFQC